MLAGVSYSDFWRMTIGEIGDVLRAAAEQRRNEAKQKSDIIEFLTKRSVENAAFTAYYSGYYSRPEVPFPERLRDAFPHIFKDAEEPKQNWEQTYMILERKRKAFMEKKIKEGAADAD